MGDQDPVNSMTSKTLNKVGIEKVFNLARTILINRRYGDFEFFVLSGAEKATHS